LVNVNSDEKTFYFFGLLNFNLGIAIAIFVEAQHHLSESNPENSNSSKKYPKLCRYSDLDCKSLGTHRPDDFNLIHFFLKWENKQSRRLFKNP